MRTVAATLIWLTIAACAAPAAPSAVPTATPSPKPTLAVPLLGGQTLQPGSYRVGYVLPLNVVVTVGPGWHSFADAFVLSAGERTAVAFYRVMNGYSDPCDWQGHELEPAIGPSVDDLMAAVASRPERKPSQPAPLTLSSWSGKVVEWSVPLDANFADCDLGQYQTWTVSNWGGGDVGQRFQQAPGQMNRYYALDINGTRLVIDESWGTDATAVERTELRALVESLSITQ